MLKQFGVIRKSFDDTFPESIQQPEPPPDYLLHYRTTMNVNDPGVTSSHPRDVQTRLAAPDKTHDGLILPKKLKNPCLESSDRQDLHRELIMNHKIGHDVLKKSELQKKLEDRENSRQKREWEEYKWSRRTSLELMLEQRANKYRQEEEALNAIKENETNEQQPEYLKIHAKITASKST